MHPISQYHAHRLLELVASNRTRVKSVDHVDPDIWARANPPVLGRVYSTRASAAHDLKSGHLGADIARVTPTPVQPLLQLRSSAPLHGEKEVTPIDGHLSTSVVGGGGGGNAVSPAAAGVMVMTRAESEGSRMSKISSVPSFGKIGEPLSGDSVRLSHAVEDSNADAAANLAFPAQIDARRKRSARADYEEFGSEALITRVYDDDVDDVDAESSSRLFREIGPSISVARGLGETDGDASYGREYVAPAVAVDMSPPPASPLSSQLVELQAGTSRGMGREFNEEEVDCKLFTAPLLSLPPPPPPPLPEEPVVYHEGEGVEGERVVPPPTTPPPAEAFVRRGDAVDGGTKVQEDDEEVVKDVSKEGGNRSTSSGGYLSRSESTEYSEDLREEEDEKEAAQMVRVETLQSVESAPREVVSLGR